MCGPRRVSKHCSRKFTVYTFHTPAGSGRIVSNLEVESETAFEEPNWNAENLDNSEAPSHFSRERTQTGVQHHHPFVREKSRVIVCADRLTGSFFLRQAAVGLN